MTSSHVRAERLGRAWPAALCLCVAAVRPVRADVDLNGPWSVTLTGPGITGLSCVFDVTQVGASIAVSSGCPIIGPISTTGTIDVTTGVFDTSGSANPLLCPALTLMGTGSAANDGFSGSFNCLNGLAGTFVGGLCGNGVLDAGEECESNTECCGPTCLWVSAGGACAPDADSCTYDVCDAAHACTHPLAPPGTGCEGDGNQCTDDVCDGGGTCTHPTDDTNECTDGNDCTENDACSGGVCAGTNRPAGSACGADASLCTPDTCDGAGTCNQGPCSPCCASLFGCVEAPLPDCKKPTLPKSSIDLRSAGGAADRLKWKWTPGEQTAVADFGDPLNTTGYTLCIYGNYVSSLLLQFDASILAGGTCGGSPCWRASASGFTYRDGDATPDGIQTVRLKAGADGVAKILVKGGGANLRMDPLFFLTEEGPVTAQLRASNGQCWEARYFAPKEKAQTRYRATDGQ